MKVLITGGMGVNGAVTARLMVRDGLRPVLMDNRVDLTLTADIKDKVDIVTGDICDQAALEKAVDDFKVTHIAHLAALMPEPAEANPRLGVKVSLDGTINVLEVARAKGIKRVVYTSSKAVYGEINGDEGPPNYKPVREDYRKITRRSLWLDESRLRGAWALLSRDLRYRIHRAALRVDLRSRQRGAPRAAVFLRPVDRKGARRGQVGDPAGRRSVE